jgi:hypothetical protein
LQLFPTDGKQDPKEPIFWIFFYETILVSIECYGTKRAEDNVTSREVLSDNSSRYFLSEWPNFATKYKLASAAHSSVALP